MGEALVRFLVGGVVVSIFAIAGDVFRPKSFAGLFGAAPSIALATLGLTVARQGKTYAAIEARSMVIGAAAFLLFAGCVSWRLMRRKPPALKTTLIFMPVWFVFSIGVWLLIGAIR